MMQGFAFIQKTEVEQNIFLDKEKNPTLNIYMWCLQPIIIRVLKLYTSNEDLKIQERKL